MGLKLKYIYELATGLESEKRIYNANTTQVRKWVVEDGSVHVVLCSARNRCDRNRKRPHREPMKTFKPMTTAERIEREMWG